MKIKSAHVQVHHSSGLNLQNTGEVIDDQRGLGEIRLVCSDGGGSLGTRQRRNWLKIKQFRLGKKSYHLQAYCKCGTILKDFDFNVLFVVSFYS